MCAGADRITELEGLTAGRERWTITAQTVVLAAGGLENPGLLLRSGLDGEHVGRWLNDHGHRTLHIELDQPARAGRGHTLSTGISHAWADGAWRSERASQIVIPINQGLARPTEVVRTLLDASGRRERARAASQLGTCFAGRRDGVVDEDLRHHGLENLYIVGGTAFPSYSAHHPTLTICALALRLGRRLVSLYGGGPAPGAASRAGGGEAAPAASLGRREGPGAPAR